MRERLPFAEVQQQAAVALANIAHQRQRQYSLQAVEAGAVDALVGAMAAHPANSDVHLACVAALAIMAGGDGCPAAVGQPEPFWAVLGVMQRANASPFDDENEAELLGWGCAYLAAVATDADVRARAVGAGAARVVASAMRDHAAQASLQQHGCNALANLAALAHVDRAAARQLSDARAAAALGGAMRSQPRNVPLLEQACAALSNLERSGTLLKELEARPKELGAAVQAAVAVLHAHPRRAALQRCGREVLRRLGEHAQRDDKTGEAMAEVLRTAGVPQEWLVEVSN
jgi:hypothetical protein